MCTAPKKQGGGGAEGRRKSQNRGGRGHPQETFSAGGAAARPLLLNEARSGAAACVLLFNEARSGAAARRAPGVRLMRTGEIHYASFFLKLIAL